MLVVIHLCTLTTQEYFGHEDLGMGRDSEHQVDHVCPVAAHIRGCRLPFDEAPCRDLAFVEELLQLRMRSVDAAVNDSNFDAFVSVLASLLCSLVNFVAEVPEPLFRKGSVMILDPKSCWHLGELTCPFRPSLSRRGHRTQSGQ